MSSLKDAINATNAALVDAQRGTMYELHLENQYLKNEVVRLNEELARQELIKSLLVKDKRDLIKSLQDILNKA